MSSQAKYDAIVIAESAEEAIAIASEATPQGMYVADSEAWDGSSEHGSGAWKVSLRFRPKNGSNSRYKPANEFSG